MTAAGTMGNLRPPFFDEARSAEIVNMRMSANADPRFQEVMAILVRHLHAAVREARLTQDEWMSGIEFLTAVGHMCTDWRQEFILLSDVLGISMLVDAINHQRPAGSTENTVLGPFYVSAAPHYANGANICLDGKGEALVVRGRVVDLNGDPVVGATLDVWSANEDGFYDVQQQGIQPDFNLRGVFTTDVEGRYWFRTAKPRYYPIPFDGPVGKMLKALGRHPNRAAHLHFIIDAPGYDRVVTHIFEPTCPYLAEDAVFGVKQTLVADFQLVNDPEQAKALKVNNPFWSVEWNVTLAPT
jgi:catechol 1,2-dioxygenase